MNEILQGDALIELKKMPSESVNCVMTSPPYWALRDYGVEGQLGLESTFQEYIIKLCDIFDEVKRVLRKDGTCWVNLGDTYYGGNGGPNKWEREEGLSWKDDSERHTKPQWDRPSRDAFKQAGIKGNCLICGKETYGDFCSKECLNKKGNDFRTQNRILPDKSLCLIPMRFAIEMVNRGWIIRNDIVWYKRNSMPSSVKDRFAVKWEHIFLFVKNKKYYFDLNAVRKQHLTATIERFNRGFSKANSFNYRVREAVKGNLEPKFGSRFKATIEEMQKFQKNELSIHGENAYNPLGGNPGDVWDITTRGHPFAHFAVYPEELCETPIKAGCPEFVCNKCGKARQKIENVSYETIGKGRGNEKYDTNNKSGGLETGACKPQSMKYGRAKKIVDIKGYTDCGCNAGFSGGIVLDPFFGSGTTGLVALKQHKNFIGIELNPEYIKIANERLKPYLEQKKLEVSVC